MEKTGRNRGERVVISGMEGGDEMASPSVKIVFGAGELSLKEGAPCRKRKKKRKGASCLLAQRDKRSQEKRKPFYQQRRSPSLPKRKRGGSFPFLRWGIFHSSKKATKITGPPQWPCCSGGGEKKPSKSLFYYPRGGKLCKLPVARGPLECVERRREGPITTWGKSYSWPGKKKRPSPMVQGKGEKEGRPIRLKKGKKVVKSRTKKKVRGKKRGILTLAFKETSEEKK